MSGFPRGARSAQLLRHHRAASATIAITPTVTGTATGHIVEYPMINASDSNPTKIPGATYMFAICDL